MNLEKCKAEIGKTIITLKVMAFLAAASGRPNEADKMGEQIIKLEEAKKALEENS